MNKNVYTTTISPIYSLKPTKKDSSESLNSLMVLHKGKFLHKKPVASYHNELELVDYTRQEIIGEVERWRGILSVKYTNYTYENNDSI